MGKSDQDLPHQRGTYLQSYVDNTVFFLRKMRPDLSEEQLTVYVKEYTLKHIDKLTDNLKNALQNKENIELPRTGEDRLLPTVKIVKSEAKDMPHVHSYGNLTYFEHLNALTVAKEYNNKIISPSGTFYETINKQTSFLKGVIDIKKKQRSQEKKLKFEAASRGDKAAESFHNGMQATIKINMNSMPGAMGSGYNALSSKANFNSVTSIARFFIMNSYAHAERFLESNFYFKNVTQVINFIVSCCRQGPNAEEVLTVTTKWNLKIPTGVEVYDFLCKYLHRYNFSSDHPELLQLCNSLTDAERIFIYYMSNMTHLIQENTEIFKPVIQKIFELDENLDDSQYKPEDINTIPGDVGIIISTVHQDLLPRDPRSKNTYSIYDLNRKGFPEIAKKFVAIGKSVEAQLHQFDELLSVFMDHNVAIGYVAEHKYMFRDTVISSDTDSIIFTTKTWVEWYTGAAKINQDAYNINALIVYWLSLANTFVLNHLSYRFNAIKKDVYTMAMKNEFMMPVDILTSLKKHYASILAMQEGVFYGKPRLDIKGVGLRGSNFCTPTLNYVKWFIQDIITEVYEQGTTDIQERIAQVLRFEAMIYYNLQEGYTDFLTVKPIKEAAEYKDPDKSIYFNYLFWEELFGEEYGHIVLPTKCYIIPTIDLSKPENHTIFKESFPHLYERLLGFIKKYPKKSINNVIINPITAGIPEALRKVANYHNIIFANTQPLYLVMKSFGITIGNNAKLPVLFSERYGLATVEEAAKAKEHID